MCSMMYFVSGVVLCKVSEWSSAEQVLSRLCHSDRCTHDRLQLVALDQLGDCFAAQVVMKLLMLYCSTHHIHLPKLYGRKLKY